MTRARRHAIAHWSGIVAVLIAVAFALIGVKLQDQRIDVLAQALTDEQSNAEAGGLEPVAPDAEELIEDPEYTPPPGPPGPSGPAPSEAALDAAVARHFSDHPYQGELSAAELAAAFAALLAENPEALNDQVYAALAGYLAENPPPAGAPGADGKDGSDGADGDPGRAPTQEEIRAEVEAYIAEHGLPICPEGSSAQAHTVITDAGPVDAVICVENTEP